MKSKVPYGEGDREFRSGTMSFGKGFNLEGTLVCNYCVVSYVFNVDVQYKVTSTYVTYYSVRSV